MVQNKSVIHPINPRIPFIIGICGLALTFALRPLVPDDTLSGVLVGFSVTLLVASLILVAVNRRPRSS